jgi:hypothetical protein
MAMRAELVILEEEELLFKLPNEQGLMQIADHDRVTQLENTVFFLVKNNSIIAIMTDASLDVTQSHDRIISITPSWEIQAPYLAHYYQEKFGFSKKAGESIPGEQRELVAACAKNFDLLLDKLGYVKSPHSLQSEKKTKPRHQWKKELKDRPFYLDYQGSKATVYWQKRNEMRIEKGAKLAEEVPYNKDGSLGFSARLGEKIRQDHQEAIKDHYTIEEVILKSVNEVGLFLYYGGTNGWLQLKDQAGQTLHELTVVGG